MAGPSVFITGLLRAVQTNHQLQNPMASQNSSNARRLVWRWVKLIGGFLITLLLIGGGLIWGYFARFYPTAPAPTYPPPQDQATANRQDLDHLRTFMRLDRSFPPEAAQEFERRRVDLLAQAATLTPAALVMRVSELVALADNGHTNVAPAQRALLLNRVALRLAWFADGLFVIRADPAQHDLLGAQVLLIGGMQPEAMSIDFKRFMGGTVDYARTRSTFLLESPAALAAIYPTFDDQQLHLSVLLTDGRPQTVVVSALPPDPSILTTKRNPLTAMPARLLSPAAGAVVDPNGEPVLAESVTLPLSLRAYDVNLYQTTLDEGQGWYLHLWSMQDDKNGSLAGQLAQLLAAQSRLWRYAIVDLRFNGGGDYTKVHGFIRELPTHIADDGRLYVLVNNETFSAALSAAAWLKHYGGAKTVLVGEPLGDRLTFWAEGGSLQLPNSGLLINYSTGYHDWANGCRDLQRCFWLNFFFDVPVGDLAPTVPIGWRFADYRLGRDTVLEAALALARGEE